MKFIDLQARLNARNSQGLLRERKLLTSAQSVEITVNNQTLINFSSNDYLGLANQPQLADVFAQSVASFGFGSSASHMICGHQQPHKALEEELASFLQRDSALLFSSGYMANLAILTSLPEKGDVIIADKLNHASLIDGARLSQADCLRYAHCDMHALDQRLAKSSQNKFVVTDSVFSMDGDIAPLKEIVRLCEKYNAVLIVDDAHGFGVLGETGAGCSEHFCLSEKQVPVLMGTLGKAIGGYGAFVAGEKNLVNYLIQTARSYIYTTAMPAAVAQANLENLKEIKNNPQLLKDLLDNIAYFRGLCSQYNIKLTNSNTPIQPLIIGDNDKTLAASEQLLQAGILVGAIRPPSVAKNSARLRMTLSAAHSKKHIEFLVTQLTKLEIHANT